VRKTAPFFRLLTALALSSCTSAGKTVEASVTPESLPAEYSGLTNPLGPDAATEGAKVFQTNCEPCHGPEGHGDGTAGASLEPQPKNLAELQQSADDDYLFWRINAGKPGTSMAPWKGILTDGQIWQVIAFIRTLK